MKKIKLFVLFLVLIYCADAQTFDWAKAFSGTFDFSTPVFKTDNLENVYSTGTFTGTIDVDPGIGVFYLASLSLKDIFVSKLDRSL